MEELDNEFRLLVQRINTLLEQNLKTNHGIEKTKLKLWLDKLILENENDENAKSNRNEYAHYLEDFICKNSTLPEMCYTQPPDGKLPPLRLIMRGTDDTDDDTGKARKEDRLKDFIQEARCYGKAAYDEAYEEIRRYKEYTDECLRERLRKMILEEESVANHEIEWYNAETCQMQNYFKQYEKDIIELVPHFKWSEYKEKPDTYFKDVFQQCPQRPVNSASDGQVKKIMMSINQVHVDNLSLEKRLDKIYRDIAMENDELEKLLNENNCHLESVEGFKVRIHDMDNTTNTILSEMQECSRED